MLTFALHHCDIVPYHLYLYIHTVVIFFVSAFSWAVAVVNNEFLCVYMFLYFCTEIFTITQLATHDQHDMCIITTSEVNGTALYYRAYYEFCYASLNIMFCFGDQKNLNNISWEYPHMHIQCYSSHSHNRIMRTMSYYSYTLASKSISKYTVAIQLWASFLINPWLYNDCTILESTILYSIYTAINTS